MILQKYFAAKVIIVHPSKNKLLLVRRVLDNITSYEPAGGRLDIDPDKYISETFEECAIREAKEELNLDVIILNYIGSYYFFWQNQYSNNQPSYTNCVVFFAKTITDISEMSAIGDETTCPVYPEWIEIDDILNDKIYIREQCVNLKKILKTAAISLIK